MSQTKISRISLGRLQNLGNYEHRRWEITVELESGGDPAVTAVRLHQLLEILVARPPCDRLTVDHWKAIKSDLQKATNELSEEELFRLQSACEQIEQYDRWFSRRKEAMRLFRELGGFDVTTDSKETWSDDDLASDLE